MKMKEKMKNTKKRIWLLIATVILCAAGVLGVFLYSGFFGGEDATATQETANSGAMNSQMADMISASGTTVVGILEETYDIDYLDEELYIEEIYVSTGDEIEEGTQLLKVSDDTVEAGRKQLEKEATLADLDYRAGLIDYNQGVIDAQEVYDTTLANGQLAAIVYEESLASIDDNIAKLEEELADLEESCNEYLAATNDSTYYYVEYEVEDKLNTYNENHAILKIKMEEWGITDAQLNVNNYNGMTDDLKYKVIALSNLKKEVTENETEYLKALENYEDAVNDNPQNYVKAKADYDSKKLELEAAKLSYEEDKMNAEATYQLTVAEGTIAKTTYETTVQKLEETLDTLADAKEEADENLTEFTEVIGDGYLKATNNGTVMMVMSRVENNLQGGSMILAYSNPDTVTVTVSIDQADVADLTIGESANVSISDYGNYTGTITEIVPTSSSTSRASVTYSVTVTLEGDVSELTANLTATVIFGMPDMEKDTLQETTTQEATTQETTVADEE